MRTGFRFDPPRVEMDAETAWVFARAFGPVERVGAAPVDSGRAVEAAADFSLAARIGARVPRETLAQEVGEEAAGRFSDAYRKAAALVVAQERLCRELAERGSELGIRLVFLKGAALQLGGWTAPGSRESCDVDVLVDGDRADELRQVLTNSGYGNSTLREGGHQLPPVFHPSGLMVEIHLYLRGIRIRGRTFATGGELKAARLLSEVNENANILIPNRNVATAFLLVHGVGQHGPAPRSYPFARVVADVQDLKFDEGEWARFIDRGWPWISHDVSLEEANAVFELANRLGRGESPREIASGPDDAAPLLRHAVAGIRDDEYVRSLRFSHLSQPVAESSGLRHVVRKIGINLWLSRPEVDHIYGPQPGGLHYLGKRLWRPVDLGWQAMSSIWTRSLLKRRGHRERRG